MAKTLSAPAPQLRSPLHDFQLDRQQAKPSMVHHGVQLNEILDLGYLIVRGRQQDAAFMQAAASVIGVALPVQPSTFVSTPVGLVMWVSPDEWWVLCPRSHKDPLHTLLRTAVKGLHAQVVDNSGGHAAIRLAGDKHITVLRHLGPYDFQSLRVGQAIGTVAAKANITVLRTDEKSAIVLFRRSFADYFWRLLTKTAAPYGVCIVAPETLVFATAKPLPAALVG